MFDKIEPIFIISEDNNKMINKIETLLQELKITKNQKKDF